jgi:DNA-binding XRE family transcriptional regulator
MSLSASVPGRDRAPSRIISQPRRADHGQTRTVTEPGTGSKQAAAASVAEGARSSKHAVVEEPPHGTLPTSTQRLNAAEREADAPAFGTLLRRYRLCAGLSQETLAERARLSVEAISTLERGVRRAPHAATVDLLATALGLDKA